MKLVNYKENLNNCCIYKIGFENYDYFYIGSTSSLRKRKEGHLRDLIKNKHTSPRLQYVYNKYGVNCYFEVIDVTTKDNLFNLEQHYIDKHIDNLLNCCKKAGKPPGPKDYKKVVESGRKTVFKKNYNRYLKIAMLINQGYNHKDILRLTRCSTKLLVKVRKLFNITTLREDDLVKSVKIVKRYFRFINIDKIKENKQRKKLTYVYNKLVDRCNLKKCTIIDISRNKIYKDIVI